MAAYLIFSSPLCLCILFSLSINGADAFQGRKIAENHHLQLQVSDLLPSPACKSSTKVGGNGAYLNVVHKHGSCSHLGGENGNGPPHLEEILAEDQARVDSIHSQLRWRYETNTDATKLPAKNGVSLGTSNYVVNIGLGTPRNDLTVIFDTGSDLTWVQCSSQSTSYANISCTSPLCSSLTAATGKPPACASSTCMYEATYVDGSFSIGFLGKERLSLGPDVFDNFSFGCSQQSDGLFGKAAGLMGLGGDELSLVSQTASQYKKVFSYCLPSPSSTGFLSFGGSQSQSATFIPLSTPSSDPSFYELDLIGITVGGQKLPIPQSVFSIPGTIIDSGTVITRLPPDAYSALRSAFRAAMSQYPMVMGVSDLLDTCYDFSNYTTISVPKIVLSFNGGTEFDVNEKGVFFAKGETVECLAFAGNRDATEKGIFGNTQQKTYEVIYDVGRGKIGFAAGGCS